MTESDSLEEGELQEIVLDERQKNAKNTQTFATTEKVCYYCKKPSVYRVDSKTLLFFKKFYFILQYFIFQKTKAGLSPSRPGERPVLIHMGLLCNSVNSNKGDFSTGNLGFIAKS